MRMKRVAALILAAVLVLSCGVGTALAAETTLAEEAENLVDLYLWSSTPKARAVGPITQAVLHDRLPVYTYEDGGLRPLYNTDYHPVSANGKVFGIFSVFYENPDGTGGRNFSFSSEFEEQLRAFTAENDRVCVVFDRMKMYLAGPGAYQLVYDQTDESALTEEEKAALLSDPFEKARPSLEGLDLWDAKNPAQLAVLRFDPESWEENRGGSSQPEEEEPFLRLDFEPLREDLEYIGGYGVFVGSPVEVYFGTLLDFARTGQLSLEPMLYEGGQRYMGSVGDDGVFQGNILFTLDGDEPGIQTFAPETDESLSVQAQRDKGRIRALLAQKGIRAEKLSVKLAFVAGIGHVLHVDTGEEKLLVRFDLGGYNELYFDEQSGGVIRLDQDFQALVADDLKELLEEEPSAPSSEEASETAGSVIPTGAEDPPSPEQADHNAAYLAGGAIVLALVVGGIVYRKTKNRKES